MTKSYKDIDYRVRPAKSIERKMLAESFRRLLHFRNPVDYSYIGMGSLYFADFGLFHRQLGFHQMMSIEDCDDPTIRDRFKMNVPYSNIVMEFGRAGAVLQKSNNWKTEPAIIWLDYDGRLSEECLADLQYVSANAASGSVVIVSVNADRLKLNNSFDDEGNELDSDEMTPLEILARNVGVDWVSPGLTNKDLSGNGVASAYRGIMDAAIQKGRTLHSTAGLLYRQIYHFTYNDGARMLTLGGVLLDPKDEDRFLRADFESLGFVRTGADSFRIDPPKLTYAEMRAIDVAAKGLPIPPGDVEKYKKAYRYFPNFVEAEVG